MRYVQKHVDSVIAISRYLYDYYKPHVSTVLIPPTVDIAEEKWNVPVEKKRDVTTFVYAGSPSALKEKLDVIVETVTKYSNTESIVFNVWNHQRTVYHDVFVAYRIAEGNCFLGSFPIDVIRIERGRLVNYPERK